MSKLTGLKKIRARAGGTRLMAHQVNTDEKETFGRWGKEEKRSGWVGWAGECNM
jgi:hypothetical protein